MMTANLHCYDDGGDARAGSRCRARGEEPL